MIGKLYDATILGANLSGLVCSALLVKRGFNVLVVDLHRLNRLERTQKYEPKRQISQSMLDGKTRLHANLDYAAGGTVYEGL